MEGRDTSQEIKISNFTIPIPKDFEIVRKDEIEHLRNIADQRSWWTIQEVSKRYHRSRDWLLHLLYMPKYRNQLENKSVIYGGKHGNRSYLFEPTEFSKFMKDKFPDIAKTFSNGQKNVTK